MVYIYFKVRARARIGIKTNVVLLFNDTKQQAPRGRGLYGEVGYRWEGYLLYYLIIGITM